MAKLYRTGIFLLLLATLTGCMDIALSGAQVAYNHHSIQKNMHDQYLTMQIHRALKIRTDEFKDANIAIATYNNEILLAGQVPEAWQKTKAEQITKTIAPDADAIYNLLSIATPSSTLSRLSDAWITAKVKAKLMASSETDGTKIKVVTENGAVYLMGVVLPDEANVAVELARNTDGVQKVIKIFSYLQISKRIA